MLGNLLYRDWKLHGLHVLIVLGMFVAFQVYFVLRVESPRLWMVFTSVFMGMQTIVPFTREDKFRSASWTCTLPVRRRHVVQARWIEAWMLLGAGLVLGLALAIVLPGSQIDLAEALQPDTLLLAAGIASGILVLVLPFTIRFGLLGIMIFLVIAQIVGAGLFAITVLTGGKNGTGHALETIIEGTRSTCLALQSAWTSPVFHLALLATLVVLNWAGYRLALALYRRREF